MFGITIQKTSKPKNVFKVNSYMRNIMMLKQQYYNSLNTNEIPNIHSLSLCHDFSLDELICNKYINYKYLTGFNNNFTITNDMLDILLDKTIIYSINGTQYSVCDELLSYYYDGNVNEVQCISEKYNAIKLLRYH